MILSPVSVQVRVGRESLRWGAVEQEQALSLTKSTWQHKGYAVCGRQASHVPSLRGYPALALVLCPPATPAPAHPCTCPHLLF